MNKLVYIGKIIDIQQIEGADFIESATAVCGSGGKWMGTIQKNQFKINDLVEVYLQDCIVPKTPEFSFMEKHKYKVSMKRFKGVPSEVLIMPLCIQGQIGEDISDLKQVEKYEKPIPTNLSGEVLGVFPNFIPRTDEPNFQSVPEMVQELIGKRYYQTVKVDGSSGTIYKTLEHFGCCSRNLELKEKDNIAIWQIAKEYNLKENLPYNYALQFEMVGPGIQKNRLGLKKVEPRLFNIYDISTRKYLDAEQMFEIAKILNFPTVDIEVWDQIFEYTTDEVLRKLAEGEYSNGHKREGIVIRPMQETRIGLQRDRLSFKVINLLYKD